MSEELPGYDAWKTRNRDDEVKEPQEAADEEDYGGCQDCGRLLDKSMEGYDNIVSAPYMTESGDLFCIPCGREHDKAEREADEADFPDFDPYED